MAVQVLVERHQIVEAVVERCEHGVPVRGGVRAPVAGPLPPARPPPYPSAVSVLVSRSSSR